MEIKKLNNKLTEDIKFFLEKDLININNTQHIIDIFNASKEKINSELLIVKIETFIKYFEKFYNILPKEYYDNVLLLQTYLKNNYQSWIIDQIENDISIEINGKILNQKSITHNIELFIDFDIKNINSETYEKLNFAIKVITSFFESHNFLEENEQNSISYLNKYIENPTINDSENILILLEKIKTNIINKKIDKKEITDIKDEIIEEIDEKLELELPDVINNLYIRFSKLFDRKRDIIDKSEIITIQKIASASNKSLIEHKEIYGELILEQFKNFQNQINNLDTEKNREFKEEEVKKYFENLIIVLEEISHIHIKKKIED